MSATRYDNPLRYQVDSHTRAETKHLVELDAYEGNGACSCEHFQFRLAKFCQADGFRPSNATRCHHILEARDKCLDDVIALVKEQQKASGHDKQEHQQ